MSAKETRAAPPWSQLRYGRGQTTSEPARHLPTTTTWIAEPQRLRGEIAVRGIQGLAWWSLAIGLCILFATRPIGVTYDDTNYLAAFAPSFAEFRSWWLFLIEEPGWHLLTAVLSPLGSELAYRLVLLLSPAAFILATNKIAGGRWLAVGWWSWLIVAGLVLDRGMGVGLYVTAIRQGLATSLFLLIVALRAPVITAAFLAGTIHTSFLVVAGIVGVAEVGARDRRIAVAATAAIAVYAVLLALGFAPSPFGSVDLGRRATTYELASGLNLFGYAALVIQYGGTLFLTRDTRSPWLAGSAVLAASGAALSVANAGFIRIFLSLNAFMLLTLTQTPAKRRVVAIGYWFAVMVAATLWADRNAVSARDSWLGIWSLVLGR